MIISNIAQKVLIVPILVIIELLLILTHHVQILLLLINFSHRLLRLQIFVKFKQLIPHVLNLLYFAQKYLI